MVHNSIKFWIWLNFEFGLAEFSLMASLEICSFISLKRPDSLCNREQHEKA